MDLVTPKEVAPQEENRWKDLNIEAYGGSCPEYQMKHQKYANNVSMNGRTWNVGKWYDAGNTVENVEKSIQAPISKFCATRWFKGLVSGKF